MHKAVIALALAPLIACGLPASASAPASGSPTAPAAVPADADGVIGMWGLPSGANSVASDVYLSVRHSSQTDPRQVRVTGYSGVNYYTATASVDASQGRFILVSPLGITSSYGSAENMKAEQHFLGELDRVVSYQLSGKELKLTILTGDTLTLQRQGD